MLRSVSVFKIVFYILSLSLVYLLTKKILLYEKGVKRYKIIVKFENYTVRFILYEQESLDGMKIH